MSIIDSHVPSTRPYLIRALHEWCVDNGFAPHIAVKVDAAVQVPPEFVRNGEIVLNVSFDATSGLLLGNEFIEFKARFGGVPRNIVVPVSHVLAIYARENGQGMAFPAPPSAQKEGGDATVDTGAQQPLREPLRTVPVSVVAQDGPPDDTPPSGAGGGGRPQLKRVK